MNALLWILAGGLIGVIGLAVLNLNRARGLVLSVTIGIIAAFFGGHMLAPILGADPVEPGVLNPFALLVAGATALACLSLSDMTSKRFGV